MHPILLDLSEIVLWNTASSPLIFVALKMIWAVVISGLLVVVLSKIPGLSWTMGWVIFQKLAKSQGLYRLKAIK